MGASNQHGQANQRNSLVDRARAEMTRNGFAPDFEPAAQAQAAALSDAPLKAEPGVRDMRNLLWSSIDNVESMDLDQIEYAETLPDGTWKVLIGIADVDAYVAKDSPIDKHAAANTTSVYTGVATFPMLPEQLSFDLTSLLANVDRKGIVTELIVNANGEVVKSDCYEALLRNKAKLDYISVGKWLDALDDKATAANAVPPPAVAKIPGLAEQLILQSNIKEAIHKLRDSHGSLTLHTQEATTVAKDGEVLDLQLVETNPARELIENLMVAANVATSHFLETNKQPSIKRIVKTPERWPRIVQVAADYGETLPADPDARALSAFLLKRKAADPVHFPDLSLTIVKLLGRGENVVDVPGQEVPGHFALAVNNYTHATAPNRRYSDLVTQRLLKAVMHKAPTPYSIDELVKVANDCTDREAAEKKVERTMRKIAAAALFAKKIGQTFDGIVTGVKGENVFCRLLRPPVEGRIIEGAENLDVGDQVRVKLVAVDPASSHIDFALDKKGV